MSMSTAPVVIHSSKLKFAAFLALLLVFVALGVLIVTGGRPDDHWVGWVNILFFGAGAPILIWHMADSRPRLVLNDEGIFDRMLGVGLIPWTEITGAELRSIASNHYICLEVRDAQRWTTRLSRVKRILSMGSRSMGFSELNINLSAIAADPKAVYELVLKQVIAAQSRSPQS